MVDYDPTFIVWCVIGYIILMFIVLPAIADETTEDNYLKWVNRVFAVLVVIAVAQWFWECAR